MTFDIAELWSKMTILNKGVIVILIAMSIYSLTVFFERLIYFRKAKKQSLAFARLVTGHLKQDKLTEAIESSKKFRHSHLARVVSAGPLRVPARRGERHGRHPGPRPDRSGRTGDRAGSAHHDRRPEEGAFGARDDRDDGAVHRTLRNGHRDHQRLPRHGLDRIRAVSARSRPESRKPSSPLRSAWASRSRRCSCTTSS